ncbi:hypothetical protein ACIA8G_35470 [Lentzea sp. NPDC051213]|uniref:hypothetical protein n=1 Tax=Lentzea sp. NPDC051213 TaxID=3364126 RepID=UPI0037B1BDC3
MTGFVTVLAEGEAGRAGVVGWIVLAVVAGIGALYAIYLATTAEDKLISRLGQRAPTFSPAWFAVLLTGLGLLATAYIFSSFGFAVLGGILLFIVWRISEHPDTPL